ncbi:MAG: hypothetical protein K0R46_2005 [Herbinix sp.]|jgi:hypothetical protein|nr:hypothetical protein [Herbinix sp.]
MEFNGRFEMNDLQKLLHDRGLLPNERVQKYVDQEVIRLMDPYTPRLNGVLTKSATIGTKIGTGEIHQNVPYARYHYYGKLMVSSVTGSAWSHGESKILTDKDMNYNGAPMRGPYWFERMKVDKKEQILRGAQKVAGG